MYNAGHNAAVQFREGVKSVSLPRMDIDQYGVTKKSLGKGSTVDIPLYRAVWKYASGGFPDMGELFLAREAGPELVGRMGSKNVVANNDQIVAGIKAAVVDGMMEVAMSGAFGSNNNSVPYVLNATLKTENDEVLARAVQRGQLRRNSRYNPAY